MKTTCKPGVWCSVIKVTLMWCDVHLILLQSSVKTSADIIQGGLITQWGCKETACPPPPNSVHDWQPRNPGLHLLPPPLIPRYTTCNSTSVNLIKCDSADIVQVDCKGGGRRQPAPPPPQCTWVTAQESWTSLAPPPPPPHSMQIHHCNSTSVNLIDCESADIVQVDCKRGCKETACPPPQQCTQATDQKPQQSIWSSVNQQTYPQTLYKVDW